MKEHQIDELSALPQPPTGRTNHRIELQPSLAHFLGYTSVTYPIDGGFHLGRGLTWVADRIFSANNQSDAFIIEMLNMNLSSYDGLTSSRRSILDIIPSDDSNGYIIYHSNYPTYVNLENAFEISLRNIRCRVVNSDLSPVIMTGLATMVLLIDDNSENE